MPPDDLWEPIPDFLLRKDQPQVKDPLPMLKSTQKVHATDDASAATPAADEAQPSPPAKPKREAKANGASKPSAKAKPAAKKASGQSTKAKKKVEAKKASAKKAAPKKPRNLDPAKLDAFGLRKGSIKSSAAALYARKSGATLSEVEAEVGSVQFNVLTQLGKNGFTVVKKPETGSGSRQVTRYYLKGKK